MQLLAPTNISFKDGLSVDRLRLGIQQAELAVSGRILPNLALTVELQQAPVELFSLFTPMPAITGTLSADANLHGSLLQPTGLLHITAKQLQLKNRLRQALPPAGFSANAILNAGNVVVDANLKAGNMINIQISGQTPMTNTGVFALQSAATLDLKVLDPLLNATGQQLHGQLLANATLAGTWSAPLLTGTAQLEQGTWQDFSTGIGINDISGTLAVVEGSLPMLKLKARAGPGTLNATGSIDLLTTDMPIDLTIIARNARPLASDQLTVNLDADVLLSGLLMTGMTASGGIHLNRADIQIPERLPTSIAVLKLSSLKPSAAPAAAESNSNLALNVIIDAPREIFVRGRGIDAELGGSIKVTGDLNQLYPDGKFTLRRGQFTLAGQVLVFNQGEVGFADNSLTNPSLNFVATSTRNNIAATITISGTAQQPKIALSSSPVLPADEILANLLFGSGAASLSPLEMVQIAAALGSLTGVTSGVGDPLESARKLLGLDRLSAGGVNPSLEAGRYIAPGVYLGAKQGISGGVPQPVIQIDISKHLKFEGGVGSGAATSSTAGSSATNSVGVIYQIEY
ncbi:translocation/assembly module TamB domain-containing protein [Methylomonas sp. AM2-LC]|uniref:translocation/assembly module TamB domain-containing protein n=1 Tax=Methylomonas sp. AM2-LC TaxID=3153301 RepID=UPI0032642FDD